MQAVPNLCEF